MDIGPIQVVIIGFERTDRFKGEILRELDALRSNGMIRLLDLLFVMKETDGSIVTLEDTDLTEQESMEYGALIGDLFGAGAGGSVDASTAAETLATAEHDYGLTVADIHEVAAEIAPGTAAGILLVEHRWAAGFKYAVREAGVRMLAQGYLTPDALLMIGKEVQAIVEAEATIELAEAVKGAAVLDALITVAEAETVKDAAVAEAASAVSAADTIKAAAAAEAVRALIVAGLIADAAAAEALDALVAAAMIKAEALDSAVAVATQEQAGAQEALAATAQAGDADTDSTGELERYNGT